MNYISTRGDKREYTAAGAIIRGLAADGGLFVPESIPGVGDKFIQELAALDYEDRAALVLSRYLENFSFGEILSCVSRAYGDGKFDCEERAPLNIFDDMSVLELWHGPTSAFKDMALQLLPQLMSVSLEHEGTGEEILILVATSGDTGKAALEGFADVDNIKIMVFYPNDGVSRIQRKQMVTQQGDNVRVVAVKGNFDDAQNGVKKIFSDADFGAKLAEDGVKLSSANSINWGRLVPQIVYYFSAYADLLNAGKIELGDKVNFTVPTGNFGDILAGYYAKRMGLPVNKLICASNANNVLTDFLCTGIYDKNREFYKTISPSMDILISSNLERLLYHITGDAAKVKGWMEDLAATGKYDVGEDVLEQIADTFSAGWADDEEAKAAIARVYEEKHYVLDPHTAVAYQVAEYYRRNTGDMTPMVILSTASPYKFNESVLTALGQDIAGKDEFTLLEQLEELNDNPVPERLAELQTAQELHTMVCDRESMDKQVAAFALVK